MLSRTFGRSKGNHLYSSCKEGKTTNTMPVPPVLPFSPHAHSFGWGSQLRDGDSGHVHTHCVRMGGCSRVRCCYDPCTCVCFGSHPRAKQHGGTSPFPLCRHHGGARSGGTVLGTVCMCMLIPTCGYTCMSVYIHMYVCTQLWWRFFLTSNQLPSLQVFLGC